MDHAGRVLLQDLLRHQMFKNDLNLEKILFIVQSCEKQRFQIEGEGGTMTIRCVQGHTISTVLEEDLLENIESFENYPVVYHGTYKKNLEPIMKLGLSKMARNHIHFATAYDGSVKSGMRHSCDVVIAIDVRRCMEVGIPFYLSNNGVILSSGVNGIISPEFFSDVIDLKLKKTGGPSIFGGFKPAPLPLSSAAKSVEGESSSH